MKYILIFICVSLLFLAFDHMMKQDQKNLCDRDDLAGNMKC